MSTELNHKEGSSENNVNLIEIISDGEDSSVNNNNNSVDSSSLNKKSTKRKKQEELLTGTSKKAKPINNGIEETNGCALAKDKDDLEEFSYLNPDQLILCYHCKSVPVNPYWHSTCGMIICCGTERPSHACNDSKKNWNNAAKNAFYISKTLDLKLKCNNGQCTFTGDRNQALAHKCQFRKIGCTKCGLWILEIDQPTHDTEFCVQRTIECVFCRLAGPAVEIEKHQLDPRECLRHSSIGRHPGIWKMVQDANFYMIMREKKAAEAKDWCSSDEIMEYVCSNSRDLYGLTEHQLNTSIETHFNKPIRVYGMQRTNPVQYPDVRYAINTSGKYMFYQGKVVRN